MIQLRKKEKEHRRLAVQFLSDTAAMDKLFVIRKALEAEITLMRSLLKQTDVQTDFDLLHAHMFAGRPVHRLETLANAGEDGSLFCTLLESSMESLQNKEMWAASGVSKDEAMASLLARATLRTGGLLHEILGMLRNYPYKVFRLLHETAGRRELAQNILAEALERPCLLDSFTRCFTSQFASVDEVLSPAAMEILKNIALVTVGNTYSTEKLHSRNSRRSLSSRQTHRMTVPQLAQAHQGRAAPQWLLRRDDAGKEACYFILVVLVRVWTFQVRGRHKEREKTSLSVARPCLCHLEKFSKPQRYFPKCRLKAGMKGHCPFSSSLVVGCWSCGSLLASSEALPRQQRQCVAKRRVRGGGGPWRTFTHIHSLGEKLSREKMVELAAKYNALTAEQKERYVRIGEIATQCHKEGVGAFPAASSRAVRRQQGHAAEKQGPQSASLDDAATLLCKLPQMWMPLPAWCGSCSASARADSAQLLHSSD